MGLFKQNSESIKSSSVYIGYIILKEIESKKVKKISIYKIAEILNKNGLTHSRQLTLGLSFLFSLGIIKFEEPYIWIEW